MGLGGNARIYSLNITRLLVTRHHQHKTFVNGLIDQLCRDVKIRRQKIIGH